MARHARHLVASKLNKSVSVLDLVVLKHIVAKSVCEGGPQPRMWHRRQRQFQPPIARLTRVAKVNLFAVFALDLKGNQRVGDLELVQGHLQIHAPLAHVTAQTRLQPKDALRA